MAIRRRVPVYGTSTYAGVSSKARQRSYSTMPSRTYYTPGISRADSVAYDSRVEDYLLSSRLQDADYLSRSELEDEYDLVRRSRGRDQQLLRDATNAIVSSESYATPQTSVVSRRLARGRSVATRAASVPPRLVPKVYPEVEQARVITAASTTTRATAPVRPIIIYSPWPRRAESRARSVPPVYFMEEEKPKRQESVYWRVRASRARSVPRAQSVPPARAKSVPPRAKSVPPSHIAPPRVSLLSYGWPYIGYRRRRSRPGYRWARYLEAVIPPPLPSAGLYAHKVPRRFLTRAGLRTYFSDLRGYYEHGIPGKAQRRDREGDEFRAGIRRGAIRNRVIATPAARATPSSPLAAWILAVARLRDAKPKPVSARVSLSDFPKVYVPPRKGVKPSNRAKAAIIASKLEPDPLKRRRPKSEYAAAKYRAIRKEQQESVYGGVSSTGLSASTPPLYLQGRRRR